MSSSRTYEEAQEDYKHVMGSELGHVYHLLWNECALLHMRFEEFVELFGKGQEQIDIMNETAPGFFHSVQNMYWETLLLGLCRFADSWRVAGRETLSLDQLPRLPGAQAVPRLNELVIAARGKMKFAQDWRNRSIAHSDLRHALDSAAEPLATAGRADVREALAAIVDVLNAIEGHFTGAGLGFIGTGAHFGGTHLLNQLRVASTLQKEWHERMLNNTPREDDFDYKKWHGTP